MFSSVFVSKNEFSYFSWFLFIIGSSFKLVSVRLKRSVTVVLQGYLYVGPSLCGFNIFGIRTVFSADACCLSVCWPLSPWWGCADRAAGALGSRRQWRLMCCLEHTVGAEGAGSHSWSLGPCGGSLPLLELVESVSYSLSGPSQKKAVGWIPYLLSHSATQQHLASKVAQASSACTFRCGCTRLQTLQTVFAQSTLVFFLGMIWSPSFYT